MSLSKKDQHHLQASVGYTQLGMNQEALAELDQVSSTERISTEVLALELAILHQSCQWIQALKVAEQILLLDAGNPDWHIAAAYASRRSESLTQAEIILSHALQLFPDNALVHYNLGCYAAQLGEIERSCDLVREAFRLDPKFKKISKTDPDLDPIREELKKTGFIKK
jgi:tetratricopeptide (TPR) repeat protein